MSPSCVKKAEMHRRDGLSAFGSDEMAFVSWNVVLHHAFVLLELCVCVTGCNGAWYRHTDTKRGVFVYVSGTQTTQATVHLTSAPFLLTPFNTQNTHMHMHTVTDG